MKKLLFVIFIFIAGAVFGQEFTFRGLPWGATQEQIIAILGQPDDEFEEVGTLVYDHTEVAGHDAELHLWGTSPIFRLQQAIYSIRPDEENESILKVIFFDLVNKLSVLYGTPNTYKYSSEPYWEPYWVVGKTLIELIFTSRNRSGARNIPSLIIHYKSPEINGYGKL